MGLVFGKPFFFASQIRGFRFPPSLLGKGALEPSECQAVGDDMCSLESTGVEAARCFSFFWGKGIPEKCRFKGLPCLGLV